MQKSRKEDRHSCHNVSFILGLAVQTNKRVETEKLFAMMLKLVDPVAGQAAN